MNAHLVDNPYEYQFFVEQTAGNNFCHEDLPYNEEMAAEKQKYALRDVFVSETTKDMFQVNNANDYLKGFSNHPIYDEYGSDSCIKEKDDSLSALQQEDFQNFDIEINNHDILDPFGINQNVSYYDDYDTEAISSWFEDHINHDNFHKISSLSLKFYHVAPIFDKYDDDFKIKDPDIRDMVESDQ